MLISVLKYNLLVYKKSYKYVVPLLVLTIYMTMTYLIKPIDVTGTMIVSAIVIFILMSWIGFTCLDNNAIVAEQILILKIKSNNLYWIYKIIFISLLSIFLSLFALIVPILINIINKFTLFKPQLMISDISLGFLFHILLGIMGGIIGIIFQPRKSENKKLASLLVILVALLSVIHSPIINEFPFAKYILWIVPPVNQMSDTFVNLKHFTIGTSIMPAFIMLIYILIECFVLITMMKRKLY